MNDPELYIKTGSIHIPILQLLVRDIFKNFPWTNGERILDVGTGTGQVTTGVILPALPKDAKLVGADVSEAMLEYATANYPHERVEYKMLDIQQKLSSDWKVQSFDKVLSFFALQFITDFRQTAENLSQLLKRDGLLLIILVAKHPFNTVMQNIEKRPSWSSCLTDTDLGLRIVENCPNLQEFLNGHFTAAGFKILSSQVQSSEGNLQSVDHLINLFRSVSTYATKISSEKLEEYIHLVKEELLKHESVIVTETGKVKLLWDSIVVIAKKA